MSYSIEDQRKLQKMRTEKQGAAGIGSGLEIATEALYRSILSPGDFAIDVGANRARHTIPMARAVGPEGRILAVEAAKETAIKLQRDLNAAKIPDVVEIGNYAVSDKPGVGEFTYVPSATGLSSLKSDDKIESYADRLTETVTINRLDDMVSDDRIAKFMKLDIEGAELFALKGAARILRNHRPILAFENGGLRYARRFNYTSVEFFDFFEKAGYKIYTPYATPFGPDWDTGAQPGQLFALPVEKVPDATAILCPPLIEAVFLAMPGSSLP